MKSAKSIRQYLRVNKHSETLHINQLSLMRTENEQPVYKFGFGQSPFPVPQAITISLALAAHRKEYMSVQGYLPLREAIATFHKEKEQKNWEADNIIIGSGSKILLFCVMAAFIEAEILLPAPSWVSYEPQGILAGHNVNWLDTKFKDKWRITPEQLEQYCIQRNNPDTPLVLILNYPSNPTGQTYHTEELAALAKVMRKYNIIVIADEIYSLLSYEQNYNSIADFYPEGCIVSSGLSKWCGAGGWRLGFMYIPPQLENLLQTVIGVASETYSCAPSPVQIAATKAYSSPEQSNDFINKQINVLTTISKYCCEKLNSIDIKVHAAEGGFYLFPDFSSFRKQLENRNIHTSEQLTKVLMDETGVALLPGSAFGMPSSSLTTRLAFVDFDGKTALKIDTQKYNFNKIKKGISILCEWLLALPTEN
ncbi:MAG: pyridoxal phosphate-dependent aminotransferase [Litorilituus sp.]|nr:pyridoxal phosphate-dependent aminotransferase [Litorilituus sp.]